MRNKNITSPSSPWANMTHQHQASVWRHNFFTLWRELHDTRNPCFNRQGLYIRGLSSRTPDKILDRPYYETPEHPTPYVSDEEAARTAVLHGFLRGLRGDDASEAVVESSQTGNNQKATP